MKNNKKEKIKQLGMNPSTAQHELKKNILFNLIQRLKLDFCYQCGAKIETVEELSIEHKIPWLHSKNPKELFFNLDNIAFSHLKCNISANRGLFKKTEKSLLTGKQTCTKCDEEKELKDFNKMRSSRNGHRPICRKCQNEYNKNYMRENRK